MNMMLQTAAVPLSSPAELPCSAVFLAALHESGPRDVTFPHSTKGGLGTGVPVPVHSNVLANNADRGLSSCNAGIIKISFELVLSSMSEVLTVVYITTLCLVECNAM
jgi:hypothetical protein